MMVKFRSVLISVTTMILLCFSGCNQPHIRSAREQIEKISAKLAPDSRTELCSVTAVKGPDKSIIIKGETTSPEIRSEIIKALSEIHYNLVDSILILPDTTVNKKYFGLATLSVINLRKLPDHSSELVSQALLGTPVKILKNEDSWLLVQTPDKYISWTEESSVRALTTRELNEWRKSDRYVYLNSTGWIYSNTLQTSVTGDIVAGCIVSVTGETGDYLRVFLPDGREGFIEKKSALPWKDFISEPGISGENIRNQALMLQGVPYLWGGTSPKGVDCSGLVQNVFFMNGLILQRDASMQATHGRPVDITRDFNNLEKGDLLFFGNAKRIWHVAIYAGNGEYIHSSGRVMVNSLDSLRSNYIEYRRNSLVKAMRIAGFEDEGIIPLKKHPWY